jgi:PAS domain S-box-containing protein
MDENDQARARIADLLRRAEALARVDPPAEQKQLSPEAAQQTLHELRVNQIELEMQNEELRRSYEELAQSRARYFDLYEHAPVGYCTVSAEGRILEANLTACTLLGADRSSLVGQLFTRFLFKLDQDIYYLHRHQLLGQGCAQPCDLRMVKMDDTAIWVRLTTTTAPAPWTSPADQPALRIVLGDIGERKRLEVENAKLAATLQEARKLETLGVLAGGVAHDFNNLLTTILGNANLGALAARPDGELATCFGAIEKAAMRAADLTRQMLAYAGKGKLLVTEVDLGILVQEIILLLAVTIPSRVSLQCDLAEHLPLVKGDTTQLFQIVMNLVTNAAEAFGADAGGRITVRTRTETVDQAGTDTGSWALPMSPGQYVTVEVSDSGAGMTPEVEARAFDPFFSTKFTGRGLGLAAVIGTLRSHGGGLMVRSQSGQGSSFKIYLPVLQELCGTERT